MSEDDFPRCYVPRDRLTARRLLEHGMTIPALRSLPLVGAVRGEVPPARIATCDVITGKPGREMAWLSWYDLLDIRDIGPVRLLGVVNFLRSRGAELPWFAQFDEFSARWAELEGRHREPAREAS